jgi:hypothetical protein
VRSREGDPDHWIQATGEPLDQNLCGVSRIGGSGVERISFRLQSHEVPSTEGSYGHVAHPLGGAAGLTGGITTSTQRKVEAGDRWWTHVTWEGVNPLLTYRASGFTKEEHEGSTP